MEKFVGRSAERKIMESALVSNRAELIAIYGRRRVGKTFLVRSVYQKQLVFEYTGLHNGMMQEQLENFSRSLAKAMKVPVDLATPANWPAAFGLLERILGPIVKKRRVVLFFDEFPWINSPRSNFLKSFDHFWNTWASKHANITVVICGSAASWMIRNIVKTKGGLHNRVTVRMNLAPFTLLETEQYLRSRSVKLDRYQLLQLYMVMGGIPQYLSNIVRGESATMAIDRTCFTKHGYLTDEFSSLYSSLFDESANHIAIVRQLAKISRGQTRTEIIEGAGLSSGGRITEAIIELEESGFIQRFIPFGKTANDVVYRLSDEYSLFYLKYLDRKAATGKGSWLRLSKTPSWASWSGYAFESVCLKHLDQIMAGLGIADTLVKPSVWRHASDKGKTGAQIDLLLDRDDHTISVCEIKFSTEEYTITSRYADDLARRREVFAEVSKTKKAIFLTMVTTYGVKRNPYYNKLIQSELTMQDLFA
ncbi:AAA family ATPase [Sediminibacterium soli]|uniref:AAA family ATPase n=1 Tax=Sediminibacterium soli TaxID=2698829 RepID=UPI0013797046|nr:ATP-binding protein [Sediminibacterium soli]NCI47251.1 AAA family ATPase [Sediminibacterium soli]